MSIDSIIYLGVAGTIFCATLAAFGYLFHDDKDDPGLLGTSLVCGLVAVFWPVLLTVGVLTTPFWAGKGLKALRNRAEERKRLARQGVIETLTGLLRELNEISVARTVIEEQLAELRKQR